MSRRKQHVHEEEHENHERWLVTYADMVTLLMVLFIVMFAMSQVDQKKFNALREGLAAGFGQSTSIHNGSSSILDQPGTAAEAPIAPNRQAVEIPNVKANSQQISRAISAHDQAAKDAVRADAVAEVDRLDDIVARLTAALRKNGLEDDVQTSIDNRGLVVSLVSRHVVFEANLASLTERGREIVNTLAPVLNDIPDPLEIDGHTNQVKVKPKYYATDWDLSAARAITVLRHLNEVNGVPIDRLTASAFGHTKPLIDPSVQGSQRINKRVDIVVLSNLPSDTMTLVSAVASDKEAERAGGGLS